MSFSLKKVLFKDFADEHRSKLSEKYPFLTNQQIRAKLRQSWKRVCQENKDNAKHNRLVKKSSQLSSSLVEEKKCPGSGLKRLFESTGSPFKTDSRSSSQTLGSPVSEVDSGPWYDEITTDSEPLESPRISRENFTEETLKDVIDHNLHIEEHDCSPEKESNIVKSETVVSGLFHPSKISLENKELSTVQGSRLLSSEQNEGDSNFKLMFEDDEEIFL